ncbi:hypothetical protein C4N20_15935 [Fusobacterium ulcerans]|uniref:Asp23/Gls24 family envelope stress response protein n=2 Tax=Fusobacterium ulcerans TaxID=861 RepID=A0AAX1TNP1_9FUSO|nr:hypothetical protein [Fusobacterium ulcerans]AVQ29520.1 hypothetical protein C4N20_15935 [Fusobacterium ulcerans]EFS26973.2 hypothetical protein FUAG_02488 [Fusobacterium ulcerans ATCC 49185]EHO84636.1 hypothetical protein HMPREF0402_00196 [Fusobacterium ulcerans 12-1B]RGY62456.1 hypothetical protein DXA30_12480 [Fusobacterium ulcerans]SQJ04010.1 Uncharacterised protein [Fusobacterium ulcerans]
MRINSETTHSIIPALLINKAVEEAKNHDIPCNVAEMEIFTVMDTVNLYFFKDENAVYKMTVDCINSGEEYVRKYMDLIKTSFAKALNDFGNISKVEIVRGANS